MGSGKSGFFCAEGFVGRENLKVRQSRSEIPASLDCRLCLSAHRLIALANTPSLAAALAGSAVNSCAPTSHPCLALCLCAQGRCSSSLGLGPRMPGARRLNPLRPLTNRASCLPIKGDHMLFAFMPLWLSVLQLFCSSFMQRLVIPGVIRLRPETASESTPVLPFTQPHPGDAVCPM